MDISNIYLKKRKFWNIRIREELKLVGLEWTKKTIYEHQLKHIFRASCWWCRLSGTGTTGFRSPQALNKEGERSRFFHFRIWGNMSQCLHDNLGTLGTWLSWM